MLAGGLVNLLHINIRLAQKSLADFRGFRVSGSRPHLSLQSRLTPAVPQRLSS